MATTVELLLRRHLYFVFADAPRGAVNDNDRLRLARRLYEVKCDGCGTTIGQTESLSDSAAGGHCDRCAAQNAVRRFEVGKTYFMSSPGDRNCVWTFHVVARTLKSVTLQASEEEKPIRRCIKVYCGAEHCMPFGTFSLAPSLSAEKEVKP